MFSYLLLSSSATHPPLSHYRPPPILSPSPFPKSNIILLGLEHSAPRPSFIQSICLVFLLRASIPELLHLSTCFLEILQHWAKPKADLKLFLKERRIVCDIFLFFQLLLLDSSEIKWRLLPKSPASQTTVISEIQKRSIHLFWGLQTEVKDLNMNSKCYHISFIFILFFYLGSNILLFYCIAIKLCNLNCASLKMHKSQYELKYFSSLFHQVCWLPWLQCILFSTNWQPRMLKSYWVNWQWAESHKPNKNRHSDTEHTFQCRITGCSIVNQRNQ